jgi:hypothetical protein
MFKDTLLFKALMYPLRTMKAVNMYSWFLMLPFMLFIFVIFVIFSIVFDCVFAIVKAIGLISDSN